MAGIDYVSCAKCGTRLIYDGDWHIRDQLVEYAGSCEIWCGKCAQRLVEQVEKYKKRLKR